MREVYFCDYQKLISNGDWIGNLLEHLYQYNVKFFVLRRRMSNLLECPHELTDPYLVHVAVRCARVRCVI